ncbi:MAG: hypothetical protein ABFD16_20250 [Thermoguttaceae bacterium]
MFQRETDSECIERARKQVEFLEKWGKWAGIGYVALGVLTAAPAFGFFWLVGLFAADLHANAQNPAAPQPRDLMWAGFTLGLVMGILAGVSLHKAGHLVVQGIGYLRGEPTSSLLVRYHNGIAAMIENQREECENADTTQPPQGATLSDQVR